MCICVQKSTDASQQSRIIKSFVWPKWNNGRYRLDQFVFLLGVYKSFFSRNIDIHTHKSVKKETECVRCVPNTHATCTFHIRFTRGKYIKSHSTETFWFLVSWKRYYEKYLTKLFYYYFFSYRVWEKEKYPRIFTHLSSCTIYIYI